MHTVIEYVDCELAHVEDIEEGLDRIRRDVEYVLVVSSAGTPVKPNAGRSGYETLIRAERAPSRETGRTMLGSRK